VKNFADNNYFMLSVNPRGTTYDTRVTRICLESRLGGENGSEQNLLDGGSENSVFRLEP